MLLKLKFFFAYLYLDWLFKAKQDNGLYMIRILQAVKRLMEAEEALE
jgi:hypothetical protein